MKLLTKNTDYAVRALLVLGKKPGEYISARDISKQQGIPYQYMRKILGTLIKKGLVVSREGGKGGFRIKKDPAGIKVADVITAFQGDIELSECMFRKKLCAKRASCVLREKIMEIESMVAERFRGITIKSLLKETGER